MDIGSRAEYPSSDLSNFAPHSFVFDGVSCASMEGLLQALKFANHRIQVEVCELVGIDAKRRGRSRDEDWKKVQRLWWRGIAYDRHGRAYQQLLNRAFDALSQNTDFQEALLATGDSSLTHTIGRSEESETCLTEREFCSRLEETRTQLQQV